MITEFRPRESQMPEDMPALLKLVNEDLAEVIKQVPGVVNVRVWATMNTTLALHIEFTSPEAVLAHAKNPNPDLMGVMAAILRRTVVVKRETLTTLPFDLFKLFLART